MKRKLFTFALAMALAVSLAVAAYGCKKTPPPEQEPEITYSKATEDKVGSLVDDAVNALLSRAADVESIDALDISAAAKTDLKNAVSAGKDAILKGMKDAKITDAEAGKLLGLDFSSYIAEISGGADVSPDAVFKDNPILALKDTGVSTEKLAAFTYATLAESRSVLTSLSAETREEARIPQERYDAVLKQYDDILGAVTRDDFVLAFAPALDLLCGYFTVGSALYGENGLIATEEVEYGYLSYSWTGWSEEFEYDSADLAAFIAKLTDRYPDLENAYINIYYDEYNEYRDAWRDSHNSDGKWPSDDYSYSYFFDALTREFDGEGQWIGSRSFRAEYDKNDLKPFIDELVAAHPDALNADIRITYDALYEDYRVEWEGREIHEDFYTYTRTVFNADLTKAEFTALVQSNLNELKNSLASVTDAALDAAASIAKKLLTVVDSGLTIAEINDVKAVIDRQTAAVKSLRALENAMVGAAAGDSVLISMFYDDFTGAYADMTDEQIEARQKDLVIGFMKLAAAGADAYSGDLNTLRDQLAAAYGDIDPWWAEEYGDEVKDMDFNAYRAEIASFKTKAYGSDPAFAEGGLAEMLSGMFGLKADHSPVPSAQEEAA